MWQHGPTGGGLKMPTPKMPGNFNPGLRQMNRAYNPAIGGLSHLLMGQRGMGMAQPLGMGHPMSAGMGDNPQMAILRHLLGMGSIGAGPR